MTDTTPGTVSFPADPTPATTVDTPAAPVVTPGTSTQVAELPGVGEVD